MTGCLSKGKCIKETIRNPHRFLFILCFAVVTIFLWFSYDFMRLLNRFSWIISCQSKLALRILSFTYLRHTVATCVCGSLSLSLCFPLCLGCYLQMLSRSWANQKYAKFCLCCQRRLKGKPFDMVANLLKWVKDVSLTCCKVNNTQQQQQ